MGVCIETRDVYPFCRRWYVTPYMGVWIETRPQIKQMLTNLVTPYMGVCIETLGPTYFKGKTESHTLYGCVD